MDEMFLIEKERLYKDNKQLIEIIGLCTQTVADSKFLKLYIESSDQLFLRKYVSGVCPFNNVFGEDDQRPSNCLPHPLELLKCVRQIGVPVNI